MNRSTHSVQEGLSPVALPELSEAPGVSYIMPILNEAGHVEEAITTILAQE